jgi:hypothetical protein
MTDIDRILVEQLPALADTLPVPPGRLDAVLARSAERRRRAQQARLTSLTLVVVLVAGLVASRLDSPGKGQVTVSSTNSSLRRGNTGITWRRTDTTDALGWTDSQTAGGALYALSTAPGPADPTARTAPARALYKSDDGVRWTPAATLGGDLFLSDLSARGDRLYGLGTGTASAVTTTGRSVADLTVSWSDDGAKTWKKTALPVDLRAIAAKATTVSVGTPRIAAGPRGVVAVASVNAELDLSTVLPAGVTAPNGYALSDSGVDILGPGSGCPAGSSAQPAGSPSPPTTIRSGTTPATTPGQVQATTCYPARGGTASMVTPQAAQGVVRSFTWAQLGVGGDLLQAVQGGAMAFSSTDGTTFERAALPDGRVGALDLVAGDDGFTLVGLTNAPGKAAAAIVLRSDDGRAWVRSAIPPVPGVPRALGQLDGRVSMVGVGPADPTVSVLGGGGWSTSSLRDALDPGVVEKGSVSLEGAAVGPLGVVAVLSVTPDQIARPVHRAHRCVVRGRFIPAGRSGTSRRPAPAHPGGGTG